mgnify:CR=1 FL=1
MAQLVVSQAERLGSLALVPAMLAQRMLDDRTLMRIHRSAQVRDALKQQANSKVRKKKKTEDVQEEVRGLSLKYDLTKGVGLYDLRYVRVGKISSSFKRYASKKAPQDRCLSLFCAGSKTIDLEVLGDVKERDAFAWAFDKIIGEARATRIFVDKAGAPVARSEPKKRLRMILGAH